MRSPVPSWPPGRLPRPRRLPCLHRLDRARRHRIVDGALCVTAASASLLALGEAHETGLVPTYGCSAVVACAASGALLLRRSRPELTVAAALLTMLASVDPTLMFFAMYALGAYGGSARWGVVAGAAVLWVPVRMWIDPANATASDLAYEAVVMMGFPAALGDLTRRRRELTWLLRRRLDAVEHAVDQAARQAVLEERTRLAFDIHDGLGHRATVLTYQAGALRKVPGVPEQAVDLASSVEVQARGILRDLRDTLDVLRGDAGPSAGGAPAYAQFAAALVSNLTAAGIDVGFRQSGVPYPLPPATDDVLRNCGREALTNAVKHGHGAPISLHLEFAAGRVVLEVLNGPGAPLPLPRPGGGGLGMVSMRERVSRAGGSLVARATPDGGFRVIVRLPVPG